MDEGRDEDTDNHETSEDVEEVGCKAEGGLGGGCGQLTGGKLESGDFGSDLVQTTAGKGVELGYRAADGFRNIYKKVLFKKYH